jgi:fumarate hydratase class II
MDKFRVDNDTMGPINIPIDAYWGAQTQRYNLSIFLAMKIMSLFLS